MTVSAGFLAIASRLPPYKSVFPVPRLDGIHTRLTNRWRMIMPRLHQLAISIVAGLAVVVASAPAMAQGKEIVITAKRLPSGFEPVSQKVNIADLNLATSAGVATMDKRVTAAVNSMCEVKGTPGVAPTKERNICRDYAWASARPQMHLAIEAAKRKP